MALLGSSVDPRLFVQDYSGFTRAAEIQAKGMQNLGAAIGQGIKDFGEARQERKKLDAGIKANRKSIESALKLGESLGIDVSSLNPILEQMNDPNTTPMEAAALGQAGAQRITDTLNLGINAQDRRIKLAQAGAESDYRDRMAAVSETRAAASLLGAKAAAQPNYTFQEYNVKNPVTGENEKSKLPVNPKTGRPRDIEANKDILNVQDWYENKGGLAPEETAMPTPTSQNEIIAPSTAYSFGKAVGGPDELQDKWTNKGYTSTGPNLVEGVVAVNTNKYPLGTIFKDSESGKVYVAADRHGNKDSSVIDFFQNPENYTGGKTNKRLSIIGAVQKNKIPKTKEGMSQLIEQYSNVPDYSTSSNASQIDNAISMGGNMTQQAMGTPQQQAEIARMIQEGQSMQTSQAVPQGAMGTEPSIATQQPQEAQPQLRPRSGFVPVKPKGNKPTTKMTAEQVQNLTAQGFKVNALPTDDGNFMVSGATAGGQTPRYTKTPQEDLESQRLTVLDKEQADIRSAGLSASQDIAQLKGITNLLDTSVKTGFGRETIMRAKRVIGADVANEEQLQSLVGSEAMKNIALTKGAISDREMDYFKNVLSPNMGKTTEGNKKILGFRIRFSERASKIAKTITKMQSQGESPYKIQEQIDNIIASEPLFSPSDANATPQYQAESDANFLEGFRMGE